MSGKPLFPHISPVSHPEGNALADLRRRGARGGIISKHRALINYKMTPGRFLLNACVVPALWVIGLLVVFDSISWAWSGFFETMRRILNLPGEISYRTYKVMGTMALHIPYITTTADWPDNWTWWFSAGVTAIVLILSFLLPARFIPLIYVLRAIVVIEATALLYFAVSKGPFPYLLPDYMVSLLSMGSVLMFIAPVLLGLTYYIFTIPMAKKLLLTALVLGHLVVAQPMQALVHVYVIHHGSLMIMPLMFFVFGILPDILILMAFYSWGMSWSSEKDFGRSPAMGGVHT